MTLNTVVRCRPPRSNWLLLIFPVLLCPSLALSAFASTPKGPPSPGATFIFLTFALLCFLGSCVFFWWMLRACIAADDSGLRVRGFGGWKPVRWAEVSDFYETLPMQKRSAAAGYVLETASGKICFSRDWSNAEALGELVARNAVHSRVSEWEIKGTRAADPWPVVFDYDTRENRWAPRLWLKLFVVFVVYLVVQPALKLAAAAALLGWTAAVAITALYLLLMGSLGLVFLLPLAQYRAAARRKAERITANLDGVVFEGDARRLQAAWADVVDYQVVSSHGVLFRFIVETRQGEFDFLSSLGNAGLLQAIIQCYAVKAEAREWRRATDEEALGGEAARWSGGKVGVGTRFYHYRTRGYRAALLGMAFLGVVCGLLFAGIGSGRLPGNALPTGTGAALGIGWSAGLLLGWRAYKRNGIAADARGLTQRTLFGDRVLAWEQVQDYTLSHAGGKVSGRGMTIGFSRDIVGSTELQSEIARCAVHAVDARTKASDLSS